jgi:AraC family transcriptional regulator
MLRLPSARVHSSSDGLNWQSLYVSAQTEGPFSGSFIAKDPLLVFHRKPVSGFVDAARSDPVKAPAGSVRFIQPGTSFDVVLSETTETVHLYLRREVWDDVAMDMTDGDPAGVVFESCLLNNEPLLSALSDAALAAAQADGSDTAFADHLSRCIASHIMSTHLGIRHKQRRTSENGRALSREVVRAIDFMEAHADRSIGLQEIANAAYRSPSHLARVFAAEVGVPPHRYLISLRIKRAQQLLARTDRPIAEVALDCGFTHQEHLTRLFRKHLDTTPAAFRRVQRR